MSAIDLSLKLNLQRFAIVALALALIAGHINVWQEMHLDLDYAVALTLLATTTFDIEREPPGLVPARLGFRQAGEPISRIGVNAPV